MNINDKEPVLSNEYKSCASVVLKTKAGNKNN